MVYFIPLLIPGKVDGNRRSLLVDACSLPLSPHPASAQASARLQPLMVFIVFEERGPRFDLFLGPTKVSVAGICAFASDVFCVIWSSSPADTIVLCLSISPI